MLNRESNEWCVKCSEETNVKINCIEYECKYENIIWMYYILEQCECVLFEIEQNICLNKISVQIIYCVKYSIQSNF